MKKIIPYIISLVFGYIIASVVFDYQNYELTAFQLGVFNDINLAKEYNKKYPSSIIVEDAGAYRLYYSVLSNENVINKMEEYLNNNKISFYKKNILIHDKGLIRSLNKYERSMIDAKDNAFNAINELIMSSYGGEI